MFDGVISYQELETVVREVGKRIQSRAVRSKKSIRHILQGWEAVESPGLEITFPDTMPKALIDAETGKVVDHVLRLIDVKGGYSTPDCFPLYGPVRIENCTVYDQTSLARAALDDYKSGQFVVQYDGKEFAFARHDVMKRILATIQSNEAFLELCDRLEGMDEHLRDLFQKTGGVPLCSNPHGEVELTPYMCVHYIEYLPESLLCSEPEMNARHETWRQAYETGNHQLEGIHHEPNKFYLCACKLDGLDAPNDMDCVTKLVVLDWIKESSKDEKPYVLQEHS